MAPWLLTSMSITTITNRSLSTSAVSTVTLNAASAFITALAFTTINATTVNTTSISASVGEFTLVTIGGHADGRASGARQRRDLIRHSLPTCHVDNSLPQITEGEEVLSVAITPVNASSTLRIRFMANLGVSSASNVGAALFWTPPAAGSRNRHSRHKRSGPLRSFFEHAPTARSNGPDLSICVGPDVGGAVTVFVNGDNTSRIFGGVDAATLEVEEICRSDSSSAPASAHLFGHRVANRRLLRSFELFIDPSNAPTLLTAAFLSTRRSPRRQPPALAQEAAQTRNCGTIDTITERL